ncbi:alpha-D-ribose 1-methylphosphonate 5-phosphate C-P-lyase PhnJ [Patescibacteria group bacterium]|nr:alpha-D-ribose 1-methylphosphonate 5-phosphate C-P-lyase PhnJ [Patescibacteria group bacterium]
MLKNEINQSHYNFAFLDENTKREVRRKILKAISIPGHQIPFASREIPLAKGFGTGGIQITLSLLGREDILKVIDQGSDDSVNAINIKRLVKKTCNIEITEDAKQASIIQSRHRIPEEKLENHQILVLQVPFPEPLRRVESEEKKTRRMHAEMDYSRMWLYLYEDLIKHGEITIGARYPVMVNGRYLMDTTPIPRWDIPNLNYSENLTLFGAGREKRIYAVPPYTEVLPLEFKDHAFRVEDFSGKSCEKCGASNTFFDEIIVDESGARRYVCSDTGFCKKRREYNVA